MQFLDIHRFHLCQTADLCTSPGQWSRACWPAPTTCAQARLRKESACPHHLPAIGYALKFLIFLLFTQLCDCAVAVHSTLWLSLHRFHSNSIWLWLCCFSALIASLKGASQWVRAMPQSSSLNAKRNYLRQLDYLQSQFPLSLCALEIWRVKFRVAISCCFCVHLDICPIGWGLEGARQRFHSKDGLCRGRFVDFSSQIWAVCSGAIHVAIYSLAIYSHTQQTCFHLSIFLNLCMCARITFSTFSGPSPLGMSQSCRSTSPSCRTTLHLLIASWSQQQPSWPWEVDVERSVLDGHNLKAYFNEM